MLAVFFFALIIEVMHLYVNDKQHELPDGASLSSLLEQLGFASAKIAVEVNKHIVPRHRYKQFSLHNQDKIEIIQAVGGG